MFNKVSLVMMELSFADGSMTMFSVITSEMKSSTPTPTPIRHVSLALLLVSVVMVGNSSTY